jgi:hypothetical protein
MILHGTHAKTHSSAGLILDYTVLTLCFEEDAMLTTTLPAERLQNEELLVIRESARLMGKSLEPGPVIREMLHLISEFLGLIARDVLGVGQVVATHHHQEVRVRLTVDLGIDH